MNQKLLFGSLLIPASLAFTGCGDPFEEVDFGEVNCIQGCDGTFPGLGRPTSKLIIFENTGSGDLEITDVRLEGTSELIQMSEQLIFDFLENTEPEWEPNGLFTGFNTNGGVRIIEPDQGVEIQLNLAQGSGDFGCPGGAPSQACGTLIIETNAENIEIPLKIDASLGDLVVSPNSIRFDPPEAGVEQVRNFDVTNTGTGDLNITTLAVTGVNNGSMVGPLSTSGLNPPWTLVSNQTLEFSIAWTPEDEEALSIDAKVNVDSDAGPAAIILQSGVPSEPSLSVEPCPIDMTGTITNQENEFNFTVLNEGLGTMNWSMRLTGISPSGAASEFELRDSSGATIDGLEVPNLRSEDLRNFKLVYTPTEDREVTGSIFFNGNFEGNTSNCSFSTNPAAAIISVAPNPLYWGGVEMGAQSSLSAVVYNNGQSTLSVSGVSVVESGDLNPGEFSVDASDASGFDIPAGASRLVNVFYERALEDGNEEDRATLTFSSNDPLTPELPVQLLAQHDTSLLPPDCRISVDPGEPFTVGQTVTLDASNSTPPTGGSFPSNAFAWTIETPTNSTARPSANYGETVTVTFDMPGTYVARMQGTARVGDLNSTCTSDPINMVVQ